MKRMKQVCLLMVFLACLFLPTTALAADAEAMEIGVQLNGSNLQFTDAVPVMEDGRVYVPFRAVFEALDADVNYDKATSTIEAQKGETTVKFVIGNPDVVVDGDMVFTTDAPSFVRDGRTYVPVRFAAQSLGATVGWDGNTKTVVMLDKAALKEELKGQYTLMDKYMAYSQSFNKEPMVVKGTMNFDMKVADGSGEEAVMIPVSGKMTLDGITTLDAASMNMAIALDLSKLQAMLEEAGEMTEEDKAMMEQMKNMSMDVIANMETGKMYMKSELFAMADMDGDAWYMMDLNEIMAGTGMDFNALMESSLNGTYEDSIMAMLDNMPVNDAISTAIMMQSVVQYQDKNFQKSGNDYVATLKQDGMTSRMTLKMTGEKVTGYAQEMSMYLGTTPLMTVKADQTGNKATMNMSMNMDGVMSMTMNGDMTYTATTEKPQTTPAAGEKVVDITEMANEAA